MIMSDICTQTVTLPSSVGLEPTSVCNLNCPQCPARSGKQHPDKGFMTLQAYREFLIRYPEIRKIYLRGRGELFLNENFAEMIRFAGERGIAMTIANGTNMNEATAEALEAVVRFGVKAVRCALDGATQQTYGTYRVGGDLHKAIRNIRRINELKQAYGTIFPQLIFQFIPMAGNIHEIDQAALLAQLLKMKFEVRLNRFPEQLSPAEREKIRRYCGYADRSEYLQRTEKHYFRQLCPQLWISPRITWDGRIIGCSCNNDYGYFPGNVFTEDLTAALNSEAMIYAREMLMGKRSARADIPCCHCECYQAMSHYKNWITGDDIKNRMMLIEQDRV